MTIILSRSREKEGEGNKRKGEGKERVKVAAPLVGATAVVVERHYERGKAGLMSPRPANATQRRYLWRKMRRVICADGITTTEFPPERWMTAIPFRRVEIAFALMGKNRGLDSCLPLSSSSTLPFSLSSFPPIFSPPITNNATHVRSLVYEFALEIPICRWRIVKLGGPSTRLETLPVFVNRSITVSSLSSRG